MNITFKIKILMLKIWLWAKRLFKKLKRTGQQFVHPSVQIVEGIKKFVDSPLTPVITAIIPGTLDDQLILKAKEYLPKILKTLRIADECLSLEDADLILKCAIKNLKEYTPDARAATYHSLAAMLSVYLSDGKLSWKEAVHLAEYIYNNE